MNAEAKLAKIAARKEKKKKKQNEIDAHKKRLDSFANDSTEHQLELPSSLDDEQRKELAEYAQCIGLRPKLSGSGTALY